MIPPVTRPAMPEVRTRLLLRLSGLRGQLIEDLDRLLAIRRGDAPARPDLGLPAPPAWLPDADARRAMQEAISACVRAGEPRLAEVRVGVDAEADVPRFTVRARLSDGAALDATARLRDDGGVGIA